MSLISNFSNEDLAGEIYLNGCMFTIRGELKHAGTHTLRFWAAAPADRRLSLVGSGLPFATEEQALESTPNQGSFQVTDKKFEFAVRSPNSYYTCQGNTTVHPSVNILLEPLNRQYTLQLGPGAPFKSLQSLPGAPDRATYR